MFLEVFSNRWDHNDRYRVQRNDKGWNIKYIVIGGDCDKRGNPYLFKNLEQDSIEYPINLGDQMEDLWNESQDMSEEAIQERLDQIGELIQATEKRNSRN